jgi:hypothetical protein
MEAVMSLSREEAAQTLREVTETQQRSVDLARYRHSAPFFYWWGLYWLVGYGATALLPGKVIPIWITASVIAVAGHFVIARRSARAPRDWRWIAAFLIFFAFAHGTFAIMQPINGLKVGTFIPLMAGAIYALAGLLFGLRLVITGLAVMAAALIGFFFLREVFAWWMAAVCGGALILTGYWLQKA